VKATLLDLLACPVCHHRLIVAESRASGREIVSGRLSCASCGGSFPIDRGIPRLSAGEELKLTARGFAAQWRLRARRRFERPGVLYGQDIEALTRWLVAECFDAAGAPAGWFLDAGCGSGEKAAAIARQHPGVQVVAMDVADAVDLWSTYGADNLHFVQGDVMHPPFRAQAFANVLSWGVLHHTPDTRRAFGRVASLVGFGGRLVVWIYPDPSDDAVAAAYYRVRDRHFLGIGHRLPDTLRLWLVRLYCLLLAPALLRFFSNVIAPRYRDCGYVRLGNLSFFDKYETVTFILYDNLTPEYQFRHSQREVIQWFLESGFEAVDSDGLGHFWGRRRPDLGAHGNAATVSGLRDSNEHAQGGCHG
jgi:uncharacterized protein YbaR (Trm112 family)/ubiquinone/menaquinone biosynthesis C-methylase UbiE